MASDRFSHLKVEELESRDTPAVSLVSVTPDGLSSGDAPSGDPSLVQELPSMSDDGRYFAFSSSATDLAGSGGAVNQVRIYWRDTLTGVTRRAAAITGPAATGQGPSISADGRFVSFQRDGEFFLYDSDSDTAQSIDKTGGTRAGISVVSADGRYVAYRVEEFGNFLNRALLFDRLTGSKVAVSPESTTESNFELVFSHDSKTLIFGSSVPAGTFVRGVTDTNNERDAFAYNIATGETTLVSVNAAGTGTGDKGAIAQSVSGDGNRVTLHSFATDLDPTAPQSTATGNVFVRDRTATTTTMISTSPDRTVSGGNRSAISRDGEFVMFQAGALLSPGAGGVFRYEVSGGKLEQVNVTPDGSFTQSGAITTSSQVNVVVPRGISADGRFVTFVSSATDLVAGTTRPSGGSQVYVRDMLVGVTTLITRVPGSATTAANGDSYCPAISSDGKVVAFNSLANNLTTNPADTNGFVDLYLATVPPPPVGPTPLFAVGGADGSVRLLDAAGTALVLDFRPLGVGGVPYTGIVQVALGNLIGDATPDLFVAATSPFGEAGLDATKAGKVFVYDGAAVLAGTVPEAAHVFTPFATTDGPFGNTDPYTNGLNIAVADVNGDNKVDLIAGTRGGTATSGNREYGRLVVVNAGTDADGSDDSLLSDIAKPFGNGYEKGVVVAGGDLDADGKAEVAVTRGGPVAPTNPNKTVKLKGYRLDNGTLIELNLSGDGKAFAPFADITGPNDEVIERDARVAFADPDGDGKAQLVFSAIDRLTEPANPHVRIAAFGVDTATGLATAVSTGGGPNGSYQVGNLVADHAIARVDADRDGRSDLALVTESESSGVEYLDPLTGDALPGGFGLSVLTGGVTLAGV